MEFRVLGPVEVHVDGRAVPVPGPRRRALLAALLLSPNRLVTVDRLVDAIWGEEPPASAAPNLRQHVTALRRALGSQSSRISGQPGRGYRIEVRPGELDLDVFTDLVARGLPGQALAVWRGEPLQDLPPHPVFTSAAARLGERRLAVLEDWFEARLAAGEHDELLPELRAQVVEHPLRERAWALLIRALHQAGRQGDALAAYAQARGVLADELGVDPGPELQELHARVLSGPEVTWVPRQLPPAAGHFTGRDAALASLDRLAGEGSAVVIAVIDGGGGVGKTTLAVHWAHRAQARFPDGQLYVDLRGFDATWPVLAPADAVRGFLETLGVPAERIPATLEARTALYRSLLADRRVLVVLDNARDAEQVRPLLPGSPGCMALVTSRNRLPGLVAAQGAHPLSLDLLSVDESRELLARRLGRARVQAEPDAVEEIIARCARLPLALAVIAARAAGRPGFPLAALAAELRETAGLLDAFDGEDVATQVRAVLSWSYRALGEDAARLFRLFAVHPGPDLGLTAAACLAGVPPRRARLLLAELTRAHLVIEHVPGRYTFHDLLRAYATELVDVRDPLAERQAALRRLFDHYLHTACAAARLLSPHREPIALAPPAPGVTLEEPAGHRWALSWFAAEDAVLLATITRAAETGHATHAWQLEWAVSPYLDRRGRWHEQVAIQKATLAAVLQEGDLAGQAHTHRSLGWTCTRLDRHADAHAHLRIALKLYGELGDRMGQAHTHGNLSGVLERQGRPRDALGQAQAALDLYRAAGHAAGQARALNAVGWLHALLGDHAQALEHCQAALALHEETGDRHGQATTWDSLGYAHHHLGAHRRAIACYEQALDLFREGGDRYNEADTLTHLGDAQHAAGNLAAARQAWRHALDILHDLDHPSAAAIHAKLLAPPEQHSRP
ncbi:AfsR/SARP family transcriptional regulator [Nonomuraea sediminis]|uniref:AfsR/SARP family transcriptional regulator n=1 Tax=Nonomuraea sediminis TaxID=2835864 RepID=UPI001BDC1F59|nr:BTAD domain-containing putative transcriptional regulator [Nonomuraea sediminis]